LAAEVEEREIEEMAYTKGPWTVDKWGNLIGAWGKRVRMYGLHASICMSDPTEEERANTRVAEAAPDLLEALIAIGKYLQSQNIALPMDETFKASRAIAKAEGK
jgi:hypothetical protein